MTHKIVIFGSVAFDTIMALPGRFKDWILPDKIHTLNVSFTVQTMRKEFGGTGGNCAYILGLLRANPVLVGYVGSDGADYRQHLIKAGVDTKVLGHDESMLTASGSVMTDLDNNQVWSFYPGPLTRMAEIKASDIVRTGDVVALLPSEPNSFKNHLHEIIQLGNRFLFDPAFFIPNLTKQELLLGIQHAAIVIGNEYETAKMEEKTKTSMAEWLERQSAVVIKTLGKKGSLIFQGSKMYTVPAAPVKEIADPTGAGDAYRAGFLAGYVQGKDLQTCGKMGATAAAYSVETFGTQNLHFTLDEFSKRLASL